MTCFEVKGNMIDGVLDLDEYYVNIQKSGSGNMQAG